MTTYTNLVYHIIFSTKKREPLIPAGLDDRLYAYIGGIVRTLNGSLLAIGGTRDHVHIVAKLPPALSLSEALRTVKANSSKWMNEQEEANFHFAWQEGYGAFSVSESQIASVLGYVGKQKEHHRHKTFREEYIEFLERHHVDYDERYVWD